LKEDSGIDEEAKHQGYIMQQDVSGGSFYSLLSGGFKGSGEFWELGELGGSGRFWSLGKF
jgi:hypothetical protein